MKLIRSNLLIVFIIFGLAFTSCANQKNNRQHPNNMNAITDGGIPYWKSCGTFMSNLPRTDLSLAVGSEDVSKIYSLLKNKANPNERYCHGATAIIEAGLSNNLEIIDILLKHGADANSKDSNGISALHHASRLGNIKIVRTLLENKSFVNIQDFKGNSPLHHAVRNRYLETVKLLISFGAQPKLNNYENESPLDIATKYNESKIIEILEGK